MMSGNYRRSIQVQRNGVQRCVGYCIREATNPDHRTTAILWFYPLSGSSVIVESAAPSLTKYKASVLSVDRPGVGDTQLLVKERSSIDRIERHAQDVLDVLEHHKIQKVYLMAVCLGHPYAVQVARRLLKGENEDTSDDRIGDEPLPKLKGLTLVAPFVSPACPHSWYVARIGAAVPSFVLSSATYSMSSIGTALTPSLVTPAKVQDLIGEKQGKEFGWTSADYDHICQRVIEINQLNRNAKHIEANLGADPSWQQIIDDFAVEAGFGLNLSDEQDENAISSERKDDTKHTEVLVPVQIRAIEPDKIATWESVRWVAGRDYSNVEIQKETRIESHEGMTFLGGPPRNPVLLHEIAKDWRLLE